VEQGGPWEARKVPTGGAASGGHGASAAHCHSGGLLCCQVLRPPLLAQHGASAAHR